VPNIYKRDEKESIVDRQTKIDIQIAKIGQLPQPGRNRAAQLVLKNTTDVEEGELRTLQQQFVI
jgi:hypothetical protein